MKTWTFGVMGTAICSKQTHMHVKVYPVSSYAQTHTRHIRDDGITYKRCVVEEAVSHSWKKGEEGIFETHLGPSVNRVIKEEYGMVQ